MILSFPVIVRGPDNFINNYRLAEKITLPVEKLCKTGIVVDGLTYYIDLVYAYDLKAVQTLSRKGGGTGTGTKFPCVSCDCNKHMMQISVKCFQCPICKKPNISNNNNTDDLICNHIPRVTKEELEMLQSFDSSDHRFTWIFQDTMKSSAKVDEVVKRFKLLFPNRDSASVKTAMKKSLISDWETAHNIHIGNVLDESNPISELKLLEVLRVRGVTLNDALNIIYNQCLSDNKFRDQLKCIYFMKEETQYNKLLLVTAYVLFCGNFLEWGISFKGNDDIENNWYERNIS